MPLRFIDLFAGLGGFHIALSNLGCQCVFASELKEDLQKLYRQNYQDAPIIKGDITKVDLNEIPRHDILCAGFPCQPFSKAGLQRGFDDEGRGNMFDYICRIIRFQGDAKPAILLLENVANLKGHDEGRTWQIIQRKLDALGYWVKSEILSPHQYGFPQHRKRMYIVGLRKDRGNLDSFVFPIEHNEAKCDIKTIIDENDTDIQVLKLETLMQLKVWQQFVSLTLKHGGQLPSFPVWAMEFGADYPYEQQAPYTLNKEALQGKHGKLGQVIDRITFEEQIKQLPIYAQPSARSKSTHFPDWKIRYITQNRLFYETHRKWVDKWLETVRTWDNSFLKFEWNCGPDENGNLYDKIIQFRASGIRVKQPTWSPALNLVGTQVPILPWIPLPEVCIPKYSQKELKAFGLSKRDISYGRYLSVREAAKLQGMENLRFDGLTTARAYEALGNAVNTQVVEKIASRIINHYRYGRN
ncbi:MAG: DNA (cytosine-5-)-methyltransferase [Bacteroidaceae bacterium]|nr:DNA (cytosine-5-)-methyltransferase [Bacteroidaceae bacterium]